MNFQNYHTGVDYPVWFKISSPNRHHSGLYNHNIWWPFGYIVFEPFGPPSSTSRASWLGSPQWRASWRDWGDLSTAGQAGWVAWWVVRWVGACLAGNREWPGDAGGGPQGSGRFGEGGVGISLGTRAGSGGRGGKGKFGGLGFGGSGTG